MIFNQSTNLLIIQAIILLMRWEGLLKLGFPPSREEATVFVLKSHRKEQRRIKCLLCTENKQTNIQT